MNETLKVEVEIFEDGTVTLTFPDGTQFTYDSGTILAGELHETLDDWLEQVKNPPRLVEDGE